MLGFHIVQCLREDVGCHIVGRAMHDKDLAVFNSVSDEMELNVNMFGAIVEFVVLGQSNGALVVTIDGHGLARHPKNLHKEVSHPNGFFRCVGKGNIFGFGSG